MSSAINVYFDCELTSLVHGDLLSAGFVTESGEQLYIAIESTDVEWDNLDFWVEENVLPIITTEKYVPEVLSRERAAARITEFFNRIREGDDSKPISLISDSVIDWQTLGELWVRPVGKQSWASEHNVVSKLAQWLIPVQSESKMFDAIEAHHAIHGDQHNAMADALALRAAFFEVING